MCMCLCEDVYMCMCVCPYVYVHGSVQCSYVVILTRPVCRNIRRVTMNGYTIFVHRNL